MYTNDEKWLVEQYSKLLHKMARKYKFQSSTSVEHEDVYQMASIGLLKANRVYDPSTGNKFLTIAYPYIIGEIRKSFRNVDDSGKHVTRAAQSVYYALAKAEDLTPETLLKIKQELNVSEASWQDGLDLHMSKDVSMDMHTTESNAMNGQNTLHDIISEEFECPDSMLELNRFLNTLDSRERTIVTMYSEGYSQVEIGAEIGVSQVQVSRLLRKIQIKGREMLAV